MGRRERGRCEGGEQGSCRGDDRGVDEGWDCWIRGVPDEVDESGVDGWI